MSATAKAPASATKNLTAEQIANLKVSTVKFFRGPSGKDGNPNWYTPKDGFGFAIVNESPVDVHLRLANANFVFVDAEGPNLELRFSRFENFAAAARYVTPPKANEQVVILEIEVSSKENEDLKLNATNWLPLADLERAIDRVNATPQYRVQRILTVGGKSKGQTIDEGNNIGFMRRRLQEESGKSGEIMIKGGGSIRTEFRIEKLVDDNWVVEV